MSHFLKNSQIFITAFMLVVGVTFSIASTAEAASEQMTFKQTLAQLETTLRQLLSDLSPAPEVAGAAVIQVSNDQELQQAIAIVTGGETIQLRPGTYGFVTIRQDRYSKIIVGTAKGPARIAKLTAPVTVTSADVNNRAQIKGLAVTESPLWRFEGLSFRPDPKKTAVQLYSNDVVFTKNDITYGDATNWDKDDWNAITGSGVDVRAGSNVEVSFNTLKNINFGIIVYHAADRVKVVGNVIDSFNGDAMRGLADNSVFENNLVQNALQTNANHSDGFQSWRNYKNNNRPVENVTVRNNTFLYQTEPHPLRASMQGVGMFDGPFKNWTIENNLFGLNAKGLEVDLYQDIKKTKTPLSNYKTKNGIIYVLAAIAAKEKGLDDMLLINEKGQILESSHSNIFVVSNGVLYTPSLTDGCLAGTMRMQVINLALKHGLKVYECPILPSNLLVADEVFLTNAVRGITWIGGYRTKRYFNTTARKIVAFLNDAWEQ